jgi:hypothetical protein
MGLQTSQNHIVGRDTKYFLKKETTPGTFVKAATVNSADCTTVNFVPNVKRKNRTSANMASRSIVERITDKEEHSWAYEGKYMPPDQSGTGNTASDLSDAIECAMGTVTDNTTNLTYSLSSTQQLSTLSMTRQFKQIFQECAAGAWVDEMSWSFAGGEEPVVKFAGGMMTYAATGHGTLDAAMTTPWTTMLVQPDEKNMFMTNPAAYGVDPPTTGNPGGGARSVVEINDGSDPYTDVEVTVDTARPSFTVTAGGTDDQDDDANVYPYVPTHTSLGSPISGVNGTFTIDDVSDAANTLVITAFEFTLKNNINPLADEAFTKRVNDVIPNLREVTGSITFRVRQDHIEHILNRAELEPRALALEVGGAAASETRLRINFPAIELGWSEVAVPETEEGTINVPFVALGTGSGNNEFTIITD